MKSLFTSNETRRRLTALCTLSALVLASTAPTWAQASGKDVVDTAVSAGNFRTLVAAVQAAGLAETLKGNGPFTVLAPTDEAFQDLPDGTLETLLEPENKDRLTAILTYHVVPGRVSAAQAYGLDNATTVNGQRVDVSRQDGKLVFGDANIVATDIACSNGVIHVIDRVLLPEQDTIPSVAQQAGLFKTLLAAVTAAELADVLSGDGPFTVFAPTDEAFAKLPEGTVESLLEPENRKKLVDILTYHVLSGRVYAEQAAQAGKATTLQGQMVQTAVTAEGLRINESQVVQADLETANGLIHVIDAVLIPEAMSPNRAMRVITDAINRGVPVFNRGHHGQCADIYTAACQMIVDSAGNEIPGHVTAAMKRALSRADHMHDSSQRAWALRHGMDSALASLQQMTLVSSGD